MSKPFSLRLARPDDLAAVDDLLGRSYPRLLAADYAASLMVAVVPIIAKARPELLASGRYFVVQADSTRGLVGAGGYSLAAAGPRDAAAGSLVAGVGHIRHFATDPDHTRMGIGAKVMGAILHAAMTEGVRRFDCLSTLTAVPFYAALGFGVVGSGSILLAGLAFPVMQMSRDA